MHKNPGTSPGQMLRMMRAEVRRQGPDRVPGKVASWKRRIWRPAVSGTGGIQDDRMPGARNRLRLASKEPHLLRFFVTPNIYADRMNGV